MNNRPIAVTVIAWLFIAAGIFTFVVHAREVAMHTPFHVVDLWIPGIGIFSVVAGIFILLGSGWARWLALAWMAFHLVIGFLNSPARTVTHAVLLAVIAWGLFDLKARVFFQRQG
jgi:uncharacterized membrane protein YphA (DoxX/SURF4 family)